MLAPSGSVALLADLIHNVGDALTALPLAIAFLLRSERAERGAGLVVVTAIFVSACVAGVEAVQRLIDPAPPGHLWAEGRPCWRLWGATWPRRMSGSRLRGPERA